MNASELRAAISRRRRTYRSLAKSIGISEQALYNKLDGRSEFKASEIGTIATELGQMCIRDRAVSGGDELYFFQQSVN